MCTPPFCEPARRCLGCISLRKAAVMIVLVDAMYGLMLVVVHALLLGERHKFTSGVEREAEFNEGSVSVTPAPAVPAGPKGGTVQGGPVNGQRLLLEIAEAGIARFLSAEPHRHGDQWFLQILDLDYAWAHGVMGMGDFLLNILGLLYGIAILLVCSFMLHAVLTSSRTTAVVSRWFMMFLHLELALYVVLVVVKMPMLCKIKDHFLTLMDENCSVLRFMFFERAMVRIIAGSLACWVFSSFAYLLAWGDSVVDDVRYVPDEFDQDNRPYRGSPASPSQRYAVGSSPAVFDRVSAVGEPVAVQGGYEPRWLNSSPKLPGGSSFAAQAGQYGGSQYVMPRASSSMQSTQSQAERQMLIKPPIVIH